MEKQFLAQKLLEKYKYPYLSIDHLKMGLIRSGHTELSTEPDADSRIFMAHFREITKPP